MENNLKKLVNEYVNVKGLYFEGNVRAIGKLCQALGYNPDNYANGSSLERFLEDNSGCQEAIVEWIAKQNITEWKNKLETELSAYSEEC
jgi:hypothetical protein